MLFFQFSKKLVLIKLQTEQNINDGSRFKVSLSCNLRHQDAKHNIIQGKYKLFVSNNVGFLNFKFKKNWFLVKILQGCFVPSLIGEYFTTYRQYFSHPSFKNQDVTIFQN